MEEQRMLWLTENKPKKYKISFPGTSIDDITNDRIPGVGIELERIICDDDDLLFGKCNSDRFSVSVSDFEDDIVGKEMEVSISCEDVTVPIGVFIVFEEPKQTKKRYKKIVAYDRMQLLNVNMASWYKAVLPNTDSTVTLKYFRDSFFAYLGMEQIEVTLINDDLVVRKTVDTNEISGIEIMQAVCEINGVFGHFTSDGKFDYISLLENEETVVGAITADYEEYTVHPINRVQLRQEDGDIGYITGETSEPENAYIVTGNFLLYGMTNDELKVVGDRLLEKIQGITYVPATQELKGIPDARLGSSYMVSTSDGSSVKSIILKHTLKGGQALRSTFEAVGNEFREEDIDGLPYQFKQLKGRYNKLSRTVDETVAELGKMDDELGEVSTIAKQTASYFESEVTQEGEVLSRFTQELGKFLFEGGNFAIITDNITIDGDVLSIGNGYIGGIKIGSEGLSSEDYTTLQIFKDGTGKFTNLSGNGKGSIYLKPKKNEEDEDEEAVVPFFKTMDGFHADYDSESNMSANMHCDSAGYAHYGLVRGDMESSDDPADIEMVLKPDGAYIQSGDGVLKRIVASNMGGVGSGINYSMQEQVVGTWIDGSVLYQKTLDLDGTFKSISFDDAGIGDCKDIVFIEATWGIGGNGSIVSTIWTSAEGSVYPSMNTRTINLSGSRAVGHWTHYLKLTVRYTKLLVKPKIIWHITKTRSVMSAQNLLQLSELYLYDSGGNRIDISNSEVSIDGITGTGSDSQTVDKIIDNDTTTKLCAYTGSTTDVVDVTITIKLDGDIDIASYSYFTSDDATWRDPVSWEFTYIDSSGNSKNSIVDNANITTTRYAETDKFELS